jgi:hypothetical protein
MLGHKQPLSNNMLGNKKPLESAMLGNKKPLFDNPKMNVQTQKLAEQKKVGGLERAKRGNGSKLGQWA